MYRVLGASETPECVGEAERERGRSSLTVRALPRSVDAVGCLTASFCEHSSISISVHGAQKGSNGSVKKTF